MDRKCGVAILFNNTFKYKLHKTISDPFGRYIIINISTQNQKITLVTLYGPNTDSPEFFLNLKETICANDLLDNAIILCGDWNVVQNYTMDTVNYTRQNNPKAQEAVFQLTVSLNCLTSSECKIQKADATLGALYVMDN